MNEQNMLKVLISIVSLLFSQMVFSLGFGDIKVASQVNEPLNAEIELIQVQGYSPRKITVTLASDQEFKRAGIDRSAILSQLKFQVVQNKPNTVIKITSDEAIRQDSLEFLIDVSWPAGRLVRSYHLSLNSKIQSMPLIDKQKEAEQNKIALVDTAIEELHNAEISRLLNDQTAVIPNQGNSYVGIPPAWIRWVITSVTIGILLLATAMMTLMLRKRRINRLVSNLKEQPINLQAPQTTRDLKMEVPMISTALPNEMKLKLDLAQQYLSLGENEGAEDLLQDVIRRGTIVEKQNAEDIIRNLNDCLVK